MGVGRRQSKLRKVHSCTFFRDAPGKGLKYIVKGERIIIHSENKPSIAVIHQEIGDATDVSTVPLSRLRYSWPSAWRVKKLKRFDSRVYSERVYDRNNPSFVVTLFPGHTTLRVERR